MDDEFALCWNNFQDNIATGFQNLYDRGDLVDVTLACDGKLLQAHKIVLAICSPYFQEIFITNPCKHPIIILKDVRYSVMCELLQFMYQGVVNVKHAELEYFMKMAQTLQIKGLTTSSTQKSPHQNTSLNNKQSGNNNSNEGSSNNIIETKINSAPPLSKISSNSSTQSLGHMKRDFPNSESISIYPKSKHLKRSSDDSETDINNDSMEHMNPDEVFLPPIPQISMVESRFDLNNVKRELADHPPSPGTVRNSVPHPFNFEYNNMYSNKPVEYPNDLHMTNDFQKAGGNHMDVPAGNITMLSSTSLLHGNCIFNRNNTVATQQGMKTYWLCKSYRITMCRARCITHQGRVISATGVHNHPPHIKPHNNNDFLTPLISSVTGGNGVNNNNFIGVTSSNSLGTPSNARISQNQHYSNNQQNQQYNQSHYGSQQFQSSHPHQIHHPTGIQGHHQHSTSNATVLQNMMQNVLSQNNLMHLTNMAPMLNSLPQHSAAQIPNIHPPSSLQITPILNNSPTNRSSSQSQNHVDSPNMQVSSIGSPPLISHSSNGATSSNSNIQVPSSSSLVSTSTSPQDDNNCTSETHDSENTSESNILSSITISPSQQTFKIEHI